ncbi:MAG: hypothetical protein OXI87_00385 [Albidovulum sp.]|nr:hypothetical protein [Albidovulum sp.]MDE0303330.1 hypothetical protein [Albidovulum sp.]MDE0534206.1 hypothetical protein [Albidovulum sp.]
MARQAGHEEALRAYKVLLRDLIDRRPSGTRQRIAKALGTHKSFVSQVTNPNYSVPLPAQHVPALIKVCRFTNEEEKEFLNAYLNAHPSYSSENEFQKERADSLTIPLPRFEDAVTRSRVKDAIRDAAENILELAAALEKENTPRTKE